VFEKWVLRRIFEPKRDKVTGDWRRLRIEELYDPYCSPNVIRMKSRMRSAGHVALLGTGEVHTEFWWGNLRERSHPEDLGVDVRVVIKCTFKNWEGGHGLD
jgi:hypothetical protein